jgi:GTPase SAR1 family protein
MEIPNLEYINSIAGGDDDFKNELISILKDEFPKEKKLFLNNFNKKEYVLASENVHKIKHKISMLSLNEDFIVASKFEENLKQNNVDLHKKFINCLAKITEFLNRI